MPGPPAAVTLYWGEDAFLLREAALDLLAPLRPTEVDADDWQGGELQDLATPSLFGEARALLITDARSLSKDAVGELASYLASPDPDAPLVICCTVAERGKVPAALEKLVKPVGQVRQVAIARKELEPWVVQRAKKLGVDLGPPGARALVETLGEEPSTLLSALEQLGGAFAGEKITPQVVAAQFRGLGEQRVWDLCDRAFTRDLPGAIRSLRSIEAGGDDPLKTLGGIASRLRDLIRVRALPEGIPPAKAAKAAGLRFEWQARRYQQQARNYSMARLLDLHARVTEADRALKSGATGDIVMPVLIAAIAAG
jgi:DNA polymerase-3 subunit delta